MQSRQRLKKLFLPNQKLRKFSRVAQLRNLRKKLQLHALSRSLELATSRRLRLRSLRMKKKFHRIKLHAVLTSLIETNPLRSLTVRRISLPTTRPGNLSSTHGSTLPAQISDYKLSFTVTSVSVLFLSDGKSHQNA